MKALYESIMDESIMDDDDVVVSKAKLAILTAGEVNDYFKQHISGLYYRYSFNRDGRSTDNIEIEDDGRILIKNKYLTGEIHISENLPDFITFSRAFNDNPIVVEGANITSLRGLPEGADLIIRDCPNLTSFKDAPKTCGYLKVVNCPNIKSLKGLPSCKNLRFTNCPGWDVKTIAKFTHTKKSNIVVL